MKKKHLKVLQEISETIPKELLHDLIIKEKQFGTVQEVLRRALDEPDSVVSREKKQKFKDLLASGYLNKEVDAINRPVEEQIEAIYDAAIKKAVEDGKLPKVAPRMNLLNNKGKKYARKQRERLEKLFTEQNTEVASGTADDQQNEN